MDVMIRGAGSKLAEVLKRSGLAASITDASRMASDISTTENKVQQYFSGKEIEMRDELRRKNESFQSQQPKQQIQPESKIVVENSYSQKANISSEIKNACEDTHCPHCKRIYDDAPVQKINREKEGISVRDILEENGQEFIYSYTDTPNRMVSHNETLPETVVTMNNFNDGKLPVTIEAIEKPIEAKIEIIDEKPVEPKYKENAIKQIPNEVIPASERIQTSDEEKVDLTKIFNMGGSVPKSAPVAAPVIKNEPLGIKTSSNTSHAKTGNTESIDINEMFNFSKRGI